MSENVVERIKKGTTTVWVRSLSPSIPAMVEDKERTQELMDLAEKGIKFDSLLIRLKERVKDLKGLLEDFKGENINNHNARGKLTAMEIIIEIMEEKT